MTLLEDIGGEAAINATVEEFYKRVTQDPYLSPFFKDVNKAAQMEKQKKFLNHVFDGRAYEERLMPIYTQTHEHRHLTDNHFSQVIRHLSDSMLHIGMKQNLVEKAISVAETTRDDVLGRAKPAPWYAEHSTLLIGSIAAIAIGAIVYYRSQQ